MPGKTIRRAVEPMRHPAMAQVLENAIEKLGAGEGNRTLVFSLEGFRRMNTFKAHSDKRQLEALLNRNGFSGLSELGEAPRSTPSPRSSMGWRRSALPERCLRTNMRGYPEACRGFESGARYIAKPTIVEALFSYRRAA
jgi:hypothetical protein